MAGSDTQYLPPLGHRNWERPCVNSTLKTIHFDTRGTRRFIAILSVSCSDRTC